MTSWINLQWFTGRDLGVVTSGATSSVDTGNLTPTTNPWSGSGGSSDINNGSGTTPVINVATDYWLRDEFGEVITDENGDGISLEDL